MKIKVLAGTIASGLRLAVGDVHDVSERDGNLLIALGKAELAGDAVDDDSKPDSGLTTENTAIVKKKRRGRPRKKASD